MYKVRLTTFALKTGEVITISEVDYPAYIDAVRVFDGLLNYHSKCARKIAFYKTNRAFVKLTNTTVLDIEIRGD